MRKIWLGAAAALALLTASLSSSADDQVPPTNPNASTRSPFFVQGTFGSFGFWVWGRTGGPAGSASDGLAYWHPDIEFGWHPSGRHDGLELGIRQGFYLGHGRGDLGETLLRGGWDFAFPFRNGRFELTVAPFGTFGVNYVFYGPNAGVHFSVGIEGKLFFFHELYLLVRPVELSLGQFVNPGPFAPNVYFNMNAGVGLGVAF